MAGTNDKKLNKINGPIPYFSTVTDTALRAALSFSIRWRNLASLLGA